MYPRIIMKYTSLTSPLYLVELEMLKTEAVVMLIFLCIL